jgi:hypothetical protein
MPGTSPRQPAAFWVHPDDWSLPDPDTDADRTGEGLAAAMRENRIPKVVSRAASVPKRDSAWVSSTAWRASSTASTPHGRRRVPHYCTFAGGSS